jgi:serine/threonine protein kinase
MDPSLLTRSGNWSLVETIKPRTGGQGTVWKVRRNQDNAFGAGKILHEHYESSRERRYRMQLEVAALKLLDGSGTPRVLDDNTGLWENTDERLFAIVEWVDGATLSDYVNGCPQDFDLSLGLTDKLLRTIQSCHDASILHRDIKPDNIILAGSDPARPVLIDFGMAWAKPEDGEGSDFRTDIGQELGNRFFRLPEYSPGTVSHDPRSDATMAAGILLYLLTGRAPRVLLDAQGRMPHQSLEEAVPEATAIDPRWSRLERVFRVAFQYRLDMRYGSTAELRAALGNLVGAVPAEDGVAQALAKVEAARESESGRLLHENQQSALAALQRFYTPVQARLRELDFEGGGQGPVIIAPGRVVQAKLSIHKRGYNQPQTRILSRISFEGLVFEGSYLIADSDWKLYYAGPFADPESLAEASESVASRVLAAALEAHADALTKSYQAPDARPPR